MDAPNVQKTCFGGCIKLGFLELSSNERRLYIEQAAIHRNVSPVIMEKDFWVCWLLVILFESEFADNLVFKGDTSLSKVFGVIDRFSEDIDLSLSPTFLGLPEADSTRNQANKWMAKAEAACEVAVQTQIMPTLESIVVGVLGKSEGSRFEFLKDYMHCSVITNRCAKCTLPSLSALMMCSLFCLIWNIISTRRGPEVILKYLNKSEF